MAATRRRAAIKASTSARVLYAAKEARTVPSIPKTLHEGLRAVVACTHGNAELVEEYAGIVVVCIADKKRNHGTLVWGCAVNT